LAGGLNLYGFAGGDPINFSDPFGLSKCPPSCGSEALDVGLSSVPVVSTLLDAATALTGKNLVTGEDASRLVALAGLVTSAGGGQLRAGGTILGAAGEAIQRFASKYGVDVAVVGSRARGTARADSDWDYVIGGNAQVRKAARRELPRGSAGGEIKNGRETGIDVFDANKNPLDTSRPHVIIRPK
jgi:hypothetical protein